jgi:nucleoside-diphosphate-sugar epimerase
MDNHPLAEQEILITGGAGFGGSYLAHRLSDSADVTVIDDLSFIESDPTDEEA